VPVLGRFQPELEGVIGSFSWPLPLRVRLRDEDTFIDLLTRIINEYSRGIEHHDAFRSQAVELNHLSNVGLNWVPAEYDVQPDLYFKKHGGLDESITLEPFSIDIDVNGFVRGQDSYDPQYLFASDTGSDLQCGMDYRSDQVTAHTIERFKGCLLIFLRTTLDSAEKPLAGVVF
jgi:hypothetical protein